MLRDYSKISRWGTFLAVVLTLAVLVAGCTSESDDIPTGPAITVDRLVQMGWQELRAGNMDQAITHFADAANADATDLESYLGLGYAYGMNQDLTRARTNLNNVISLAEVMITDPNNPITRAYSDTLKAEGYAGLASVELAALNYEAAVSDADMCMAIWNTFSAAGAVNRWLPQLDMKAVKLISAEAHFGAGRYHQAMEIVDELSNNSFISGAAHILSDNEDLTVTMMQHTAVTGEAKLMLSHTNLIEAQKVTDTSQTHEYEITEFASAGNEVIFRANPTPTVGDTYHVEYLYADDFGQFVIELRDMLDQLKQ